MNEKEIERQLEKDFSNFYNSVYPEPLPPEFINLFQRALFVDAPQNHQIHVAKIRSILEKEQEALTIGEVGVMQTLILRISPEKLYRNFKHFLEMQEEIEKVPMTFNPMVAKFQETLKRKKLTLMNLSGSRNGPMKIVAEA